MCGPGPQHALKGYYRIDDVCACAVCNVLPLQAADLPLPVEWLDNAMRRIQVRGVHRVHVLVCVHMMCETCHCLKQLAALSTHIYVYTATANPLAPQNRPSCHTLASLSHHVP